MLSPDTIHTPTAVKSKKATFAVIWITTDAQLIGRDMEGFCDNYHAIKALQKQ